MLFYIIMKYEITSWDKILLMIFNTFFHNTYHVSDRNKINQSINQFPFHSSMSTRSRYPLIYAHIPTAPGNKVKRSWNTHNNQERRGHRQSWELAMGFLSNEQWVKSKHLGCEAFIKFMNCVTLKYKPHVTTTKLFYSEISNTMWRYQLLICNRPNIVL